MQVQGNNGVMAGLGISTNERTKLEHKQNEQQNQVDPVLPSRLDRQEYIQGVPTQVGEFGVVPPAGQMLEQDNQLVHVSIPPTHVGECPGPVPADDETTELRPAHAPPDSELIAERRTAHSIPAVIEESPVVAKLEQQNALANAPVSKAREISDCVADDDLLEKQKVLMTSIGVSHDHQVTGNIPVSQSDDFPAHSDAAPPEQQDVLTTTPAVTEDNENAVPLHGELPLEAEKMMSKHDTNKERKEPVDNNSYERPNDHDAVPNTVENSDIYPADQEQQLRKYAVIVWSGNKAS
jgi:hypothetical protein